MSAFRQPKLHVIIIAVKTVKAETNQQLVRIGVGVFVVNAKRQVLMMQRQGAHGSGSWCPPGGKMNVGETPAETAMRETLEETGLTIIEPEFLGYTNDIFVKENQHYVTLWFIALASGNAKIIEPDKCLQMKWCDMSGLPRPLFLPTKHLLENKTMYKKILSYTDKI